MDGQRAHDLHDEIIAEDSRHYKSLADKIISASGGADHGMPRECVCASSSEAGSLIPNTAKADRCEAIHGRTGK
jgi:hypothetical protein